MGKLACKFEVRGIERMPTTIEPAFDRNSGESPLLPKAGGAMQQEQAGKGETHSLQSTLTRIIDTEGFNAVVKAKYGYLTYNKNDVYIGKSIEKYGEFSEFEVGLFRQICRDRDIAIEVGANIGSHTLPIAQMVGPQGRVYAFEPQRIVFQTLCANMAINSITNVECFQVAASSEDGFILIPDIRYDLEGNYGGVSVKQFKQGVKVPQVRLDDFLDIPRLRLLKIDVEGMEAAVIEGSKKIIEKFKPILYVENDRKEKSQELIELIRSLGYRLYWHLPPMYNPQNFASNPDNEFKGIVSANMLCFHESAKVNINGLMEVTDPAFHPLRKPER